MDKQVGLFEWLQGTLGGVCVGGGVSRGSSSCSEAAVKFCRDLVMDYSLSTVLAVYG